ncbi:MAG: transketolase [Nitrospirae bacterium]|nr:transketolase [Nitrospirota bacterium]
MTGTVRTMRDALIDGLCDRMREDCSIFFLTADFGSPALDRLRLTYKNRFINVGIAEQNLINVAVGLALEGFTVYAYAIAPFISMRAYEQIRNNLSVMSEFYQLNVNMIGVGAGLSYDVSGPTHHCLEDISVMRTLPNIDIFSPSDWVLCDKYVDYSIENKHPKYLRFDGKPQPQIYDNSVEPDIKKGFYELIKADTVCVVSTGYITHTALAAIKSTSTGTGLIDMFFLRRFDEHALISALSNYETIITIEEGFIGKAGLDCVISNLLEKAVPECRLIRMGFKDNYEFELGGRDYLHEINGLSQAALIKTIKTATEK